MSEAEVYWRGLFIAASGVYQCPWCSRDLKPKMSNSAKNPGKTFVSCSKDHGGCGLFSFLDQTPNEKFNPNKGGDTKRARTEPTQGNAIVGPVVNRPDAHEVRLAELAAKMDSFATDLRKISEFIKQVTDN